MVLLSICIPTYNRALILDKCLDALVSSDGFNDEVEVIISDNASTDNTEEVVSYYSKRFFNVIYSRNVKNIADKNFSQALNLAHGMYIKLQNDNDIFLKDGLLHIKERVRENLNSNKSIFFTNDYVYTSKKAEVVQCASLNEFVQTISTYTTKISCFGVWKENWLKIKDKNKYAELKLCQVDWFFQEAEGHKCVIYDKKYANSVFVKKHEKSQSYNWFNVHLHNYYEIMKPYVLKGAISNEVYEDDKKNLLKHFIPELKVIYIYKDVYFPYDTKGTFSLLLEYYKTSPVLWFYVCIFPFAFFPLLIGHLLKQAYRNMRGDK